MLLKKVGEQQIMAWLILLLVYSSEGMLLQSGGGQQQDHIIGETLVEDVSRGVEVACEELN